MLPVGIICTGRMAKISAPFLRRPAPIGDPILHQHLTGMRERRRLDSTPAAPHHARYRQGAGDEGVTDSPLPGAPYKGRQAKEGLI